MPLPPQGWPAADDRRRPLLPPIPVYPPRRPPPRPEPFLFGALGCWLFGLEVLACGGWIQHGNTVEGMGWAFGVLAGAMLQCVCVAGLAVAGWLYARAGRYWLMLLCILLFPLGPASFVAAVDVAMRFV